MSEQEERKIVLEKFLDYYSNYSRSQLNHFKMHNHDVRLMFKHNALAQKELDSNETLKKNYLKSFEKMKDHYHRRHHFHDDPETAEYLRIAERFETTFWPFVYLNFPYV